MSYKGEKIMSNSKIYKLIAKVQDIQGTDIILPNIESTLNKKMQKIFNEFQKAEVSMNYYSSFICMAVTEDLRKYVNEGINNLNKYLSERERLINNKRNKTSFMGRLRSKIMFSNNIIELTKDDKNLLNVFLFNYIDINNELMNYNLRDNIVRSIVKEMRRRTIPAKHVSRILSKEVNRDLRNLGFADLIPSLQGALIDEYKKDLPDLDNYPYGRERIIEYYVPSFADYETRDISTKKRTQGEKAKRLKSKMFVMKETNISNIPASTLSKGGKTFEDTEER